MNITKILTKAERTCIKSGAKFTHKRKKVLQSLLKAQKALSAYELVDYIRDEFDESMPPMSVYRILEFLESESLVHKLNSANKYVACSHIACEHSHEIPQFLICDECGSVKEIGISKKLIQSIQTSVDNAGYYLKSPQLELHCLCNQCLSHAAA